MTGNAVPSWYRMFGRILAPLFRATRSPRVGPWPEAASNPVWIHAASLGELKGVLRLLDAFPDGFPVFLTSTTSTGLASLKRQVPHIPCSLLPLDSPSVADSFLDAVQPSSAIFFESESWPCLLAKLHSRGVPVAFASFRTAPQSMRRWNRFSKLFPGWTKSVTTVWTDGIGPLEQLGELGFVDVRPARSLKWAGWSAAEPAPVSNRSAAMSIHLRDFTEIVRTLRNRRNGAWLLFPRRLRLRRPLRWLARLAGLRLSEQPNPAPGQAWIADRFGLARELLPTCDWVWVSEGHDTEEPYMLGAREVWTGSPPRIVDRPMGMADRTRTEIVEWIESRRSIFTPQDSETSSRSE